MNGDLILIIDVDDVLLDWTSSFDLYIRKNYNYKGCSLGENPKRLWEVLGTSKEEVIGIMKEHNNSDRFQDIKPFKDATNILEIKKYFKKIYCVTACGVENKNSRLFNLEKYFPGFIDECIVLPYFAEKEEEIKNIKINHNSNIIMLDDNIKDIEFADSIGIDAYVYRSSFYKSEHKTIDNMTDFISYIKEKYEITKT